MPGDLDRPAGSMLARAPVYSDTTAVTVVLNPLSIAPAGGGQPHDNMQPSLCLNYIIALDGIYPSRN